MRAAFFWPSFSKWPFGESKWPFLLGGNARGVYMQTSKQTASLQCSLGGHAGCVRARAGGPVLESGERAPVLGPRRAPRRYGSWVPGLVLYPRPPKVKEGEGPCLYLAVAECRSARVLRARRGRIPLPPAIRRTTEAHWGTLVCAPACPCGSWSCTCAQNRAGIRISPSPGLCVCARVRALRHGRKHIPLPPLLCVCVCACARACVSALERTPVNL